MEVLVAFWIPEGAPLLAVSALVHLAGTAAVGIWLVAVGAIVAETTVNRAVLPADWADTRVSILTVWVAKGAILLLVVIAA